MAVYVADDNGNYQPFYVYVCPGGGYWSTEPWPVQVNTNRKIRRQMAKRKNRQRRS